MAEQAPSTRPGGWAPHEGNDAVLSNLCRTSAVPVPFRALASLNAAFLEVPRRLIALRLRHVEKTAVRRPQRHREEECADRAREVDFASRFLGPLPSLALIRPWRPLGTQWRQAAGVAQRHMDRAREAVAALSLKTALLFERWSLPVAAQALAALAAHQPSRNALPFARIASALASPAGSPAGRDEAPASATAPKRKGMGPDAVAHRLEGIPVFTVCNASNEFVLVSDLRGAKSLALFCFREEDAAALLTQVRERDPSLGRGARVVPVSLDKVYLLAAEGIAFRFLPDPVQVQHAVKVVQAQALSQKAGAKGGASPSTSKRFHGVPIFQSENLILRSGNQRFIPAFFSKEDMDVALAHASRQRKRMNPNIRTGTALHVQVGSLENTLKELEANDEDSIWGTLVFVPPGSDAQFQLKKLAS